MSVKPPKDEFPVKFAILLVALAAALGIGEAAVVFAKSTALHQTSADPAINAANIQASATIWAAIIQGLMTLAAGVGALIAGWLSLRGARIQAKAQFQSARAQIHSFSQSEKLRHKIEQDRIAAAFKAEFLVYARPIIQAASNRNRVAADHPSAKSKYPKFLEPKIYDVLASELGRAPIEWAIPAAIAFYGGLLQVIQWAIENETPVVGEVAKDIQDLAGNLAQAIDGFAGLDTFPLEAMHLDLRNVYMPSGKAVSEFAPKPRTIQDLLRLVCHESLVDP